MPDPVTTPSPSPSAAAPKAPAAAPATTPVATTPTPAAKPALRAATSVADVTPNEGKVHRLEIPTADVPAFLAGIDQTAPAGKLAKTIAVHIGPKGEIRISIYYQA